MAGKQGHRGFGHVRRLPSKRHQASYLGPDGVRHTAPATFDTRLDAQAWLAAERRLIDGETWRAPRARQAARDAATITLATYAASWLIERPLKPRTQQHYRSLLDRLILPELGDSRVDTLTPAAVREWHASLGRDTPTQRAHAYALLKAICGTAVDDELLTANPCRIRGAGQARRASRTEIATLVELEAVVRALPPRYRLMALLASWCAMRFGELIELRRSDVDVANGVVHVRRAAVWVPGRRDVEVVAPETPDGEDRLRSTAAVVGSPKSEAGIRDVALPPHLIPAVREHLRSMPVTDRNALLFPAASDPTKHMRPATLARVFDPARAAAGRPDLRFHDLRHTGAVMATNSGASLAEVMARLGHSTPGAAMRYQHAARGRDAEIATRLSLLVVDGSDSR